MHELAHLALRGEYSRLVGEQVGQAYAGFDIGTLYFELRYAVEYIEQGSLVEAVECVGGVVAK